MGYAKLARRQPLGLVDLGSNSITGWGVKRHERAPKTIKTMKEICGIGKGMSHKNHKLNRHGVERALMHARRMRVAFAEIGVRHIDVIATAATRNADDREAFCNLFHHALGLKRTQKVRVISGKEEARLSAYGVFASFPGASGLCIDLGGGSMEVSWVESGRIKRTASIPFGTLNLEKRGDLKKALDKIPWLDELPEDTPLYMVGGVLRAIGRVHMRWEKYPLDIVHAYTMTGKELSQHVHDMGAVKTSTYTNLGIDKKRTETIPNALLFLRELLSRLKPEFVTISATGIREGHYYAQLTSEERRQSPLTFACKNHFGSRVSTQAAERLGQWLEPLLKAQNGIRPEVVESLCYLSDCAANDSSRRRADSAYSRIIDSEFGDCSHQELAILALSTYARYAGKVRKEETKVAHALLDDDQVKTALMIGLGLKLAYKLGEGTSLLDKVRLHVTPQKVLLYMPESFPLVDRKDVKELVEKIGKLLGRNGKMIEPHKRIRPRSLARTYAWARAHVV